MSGRPARAVRKHAGAVAVALALSATLAGCTAARNTLGTTSSPCFRAVAVASSAVEHRGTLAGVRLLGTKELAKRRRLEALLSARAGHNVRNVCLVAFHGQFRLDQVHNVFGHGPRTGVGTYAVVAVSTPQNKLLGTLVLSHVPLPFRHEVLRHPPPASGVGAGPT